jgi:hypothetical protein
MTSIAIMQPTFMPWIGYFGLIDSVDQFVFLDNVQFDKRSWQQRNKIKTPNGPQWISVPVSSKGKQAQLIKDVQISEGGKEFPDKLIRTIEQNYKKAEFFKEYADSILCIIQSNKDYLACLNIELIKFFCHQFSIKTLLSNASDLPVKGKKSALLIDICQHYKIKNYISPLGSQGYIEEEGLFDQAGIDVQYFDYHHPEWKQFYGKFEAYMSVLDLLFHKGPDSMKIIRKGYVL